MFMILKRVFYSITIIFTIYIYIYMKNAKLNFFPFYFCRVKCKIQLFLLFLIYLK